MVPEPRAAHYVRDRRNLNAADNLALDYFEEADDLDNFDEDLGHLLMILYSTAAKFWQCGMFLILHTITLGTREHSIIWSVYYVYCVLHCVPTLYSA